MASVRLELIFELEYHKLYSWASFVLIYVIDLPNGLKSECKLFDCNISLFSVAHGVKTSASNINKDLNLISGSAFQWKMSFNPDLSKQAQEIICSKKSSHPNVYFNNIPVSSFHRKIILECCLMLS